jgi:hypothetical protein
VAVKLQRKVRLEAEAGMHIIALQVNIGGLVASKRLCQVIRNNSAALATVLGGSGSKMSIGSSFGVQASKIRARLRLWVHAKIHPHTPTRAVSRQDDSFYEKGAKKPDVQRAGDERANEEGVALERMRRSLSSPRHRETEPRR